MRLDKGAHTHTQDLFVGWSLWHITISLTPRANRRFFCSYLLVLVLLVFFFYYYFFFCFIFFTYFAVVFCRIQYPAKPRQAVRNLVYAPGSASLWVASSRAGLEGVGGEGVCMLAVRGEVEMSKG